MNAEDLQLHEIKLGIFNLVFTMLQTRSTVTSPQEAKEITVGYLKEIISTLENEEIVEDKIFNG